MSNKIYPCLWFDGKGKEAAAFYCSVFENSKIRSSSDLVVMFELNGQWFMALNGGPRFSVNPAISFLVICKTVEEIETKWKKLCEAGIALMPLGSYPWSDTYGFCQDKYGVCWQLIVPLPSQEISNMANCTIIPSLMFTQDKSGKAYEAINFYTKLFPNSQTEQIVRYIKGEPDVEGYVKHGRFSLANQPFVAMDSSGPHMFTFTEGLSLVVDCEDQEEVDYYWNKLISEGGQESMCAWLKDKYGISWQIVPRQLGILIGSNNPEKNNRAMQAMLKMKKIIVADLQKAYDGG